jgi:hypothetical protein
MFKEMGKYSFEDLDADGDKFKIDLKYDGRM